ncbi:MAG: DMT family transporter [Aestuariivirgaceae bacterium]
MQPAASLKWLLLFAVVMLWGSSFALLKIAVATIPPVWVMALRLVIAGAALTVLLLTLGGRFSSGMRAWTRFLAIAIIGNVIPFLLISWGVKYIASGLSGILMAVMPLGVALLAHFFLPDEPLSWRRLAGLFLGFFGVVILLGPQRLLGLAPQGLSFWGQMAMIGGALCYSIQSILARRMHATGAMESAAAALSLGGMIGLVLALAVDPAGMAGASSASLTALGLIGLLTTALATVAYFQLIRLAGAGFASMINYLIPVFALFVGWLFLDERLAPSAFAGLVLILAALFIVQSQRPPKPQGLRPPSPGPSRSPPPPSAPHARRRLPP